MKKFISLIVLTIVLILVGSCAKTGYAPGLPNLTDSSKQADQQNQTKHSAPPDIQNTEPPQVAVPVSALSLNSSALNLGVNESFQLVPVVSPANATEQDHQWTSSVPEIVSVSSSGLVKAHGNGSAVITISIGAKTASATVTVTTPVTGVSLAPTSLKLKVGQTGKLVATVSPANASDREVTWTSTKPGVATVDSSGQVTAVSNGSATITARTSMGNLTASASVTVTTPVSGVTLNKSALSLKTGQVAQLSATITPGSASEKGVNWSTSNKQVAVVNSSGLVTAKGKGTAIITVTTKDGGISATATVTVTEPVRTGTADELLMLDLVNQERKKAGLEPFKLNMKLTEVARIKSQDMIDNNYFAHESPVYGSPFEMMKHFGISYRYAAENLALHPSVESAHQGLMNSEGHRANILNPKLTEIGIGIIRNSKGQYYVTQMFIGF